MSRSKHTISFSKDIKQSKGGYSFNRNGVPLDSHNGRVMNTHRYYYQGFDKVGTYRPTPHNISDI